MIPLHIELTHAPIAIQTLRHRIEDPDVGAHAWFEGVTRRMTAGRQTVHLSYEAFEPMAVAELQRIGEASLAEFRLHRLLIIHRLGSVPVGDASLIVGCSAAHRVNVFAALSTIVDQLKADVPIWKKEHFADGAREWVHPT